MVIFNLPHSTIVNKVIPKNSFDAYITAKQKKLFTDLVQRITWTHKLSTETTNLPGKDIKEIQIFKIELKAQDSIDSLLVAIDKAIPYPIIFVVVFDQQMYLSASVKHPHPVNEDNAVIDWTFRSKWSAQNENKTKIKLKKSLDVLYLEFCNQLSAFNEMPFDSLLKLVEKSKIVDSLTKESIRLKAEIVSCNQFNIKVELNITLRSIEDELQALVLNNRFSSTLKHIRHK